MNLMNIKEAENISIMKIERRRAYQPVSIGANMEDIIGRAMEQNYVPVIDDQEHFYRNYYKRDIIGYCYDKTKEYAK